MDRKPEISTSQKRLYSTLAGLLYTFYKWPRLRTVAVASIKYLGLYRRLLPIYINFMGAHVSKPEQTYLLDETSRIQPTAGHGALLSIDELLARIDLELDGTRPDLVTQRLARL